MIIALFPYSGDNWLPEKFGKLSNTLGGTYNRIELANELGNLPYVDDVTESFVEYYDYFEKYKDVSLKTGKPIYVRFENMYHQIIFADYRNTEVEEQVVYLVDVDTSKTWGIKTLPNGSESIEYFKGIKPKMVNVALNQGIW